MSERVGVDDFNTVPAEKNGRAPHEPLAVSVKDFVADKTHTAPPLLGTEDEAILPTGGLAVVAGQSGVGKTTLVLDLVFRLISGKEWLPGEDTPGIPCARPLSVLLIENEGPREQFRRKLEAKLNRWQSEFAGALWVQTWRWGAFSLTDDAAILELGRFCQEHDVDLIVGDPLGTMGVPGVGSPEDTRKFIGRLHGLGLAGKRAFLFIHHFRKEKAVDEIDQISGAWGPHLDSLLILKESRKDQVRLSFPKLRWAAEPRKPLILNRVRAAQAFELDHEEGDPRALLPELIEYLERDHDKGQTSRDIAKAIGARHDPVVEALNGSDHLFCSFTGDEAKERGRARQSTVWELVPEFGNSGNTSIKPLQIAGVNGARNPSPPIGGGGEAPAPIQEPLLPDDDLDWR